MTLRIENLSVTYGGHQAVRGVNLEVAPGQILAVLGPSGCGKSSVLRAVAGLVTHSGGDVLWEGVSIAHLPTHRRGVGLMFQDGQLFPHRTVGGNIDFALQTAHSGASEAGRGGDALAPVRTARSGASAAEKGSGTGAGIRPSSGRGVRREQVAELLRLVGLEGYASKSVAEISGGEAQRVALARALATQPQVLLLDEPLSSLDRRLREELSIEVRRILLERRCAAIYVTHDQDEAFTVADRVAVMDSGEIQQRGPALEVWTSPASAAVAQFLGYRVVESADAVLAVGADGFEVRGLAAAEGVTDRQLDASTGRDEDEEHGDIRGVGVWQGRVVLYVDLPRWGVVRAVLPAGRVKDVLPGIGNGSSSAAGLSSAELVGLVARVGITARMRYPL